LTHIKTKLPSSWKQTLRDAAHDRTTVKGLTHTFYKYPARFSPTFARTAIELFSSPEDLILDPYMGGGTTIVEALAAGREVVGNDLNSLATFVTRVKTTRLTRTEINSIHQWIQSIIPTLTYDQNPTNLKHLLDDERTRNLSLLKGRFIKKIIATALHNLDLLPTTNSQNFIRCALLRVSQTALDGRKRSMSADEFRTRLTTTTLQMLESISDFLTHWKNAGRSRKTLTNLDASKIDKLPIFAKQGKLAKLVVTSPPYPGVHVLYHRWQVDGRRESPAPYWITSCNDGRATSYYNFGNRQEPGLNTYFESSLRTLSAIRKVMQPDGMFVQLIAFTNPKNQLPRYLSNMEKAGFKEIRSPGNRIYRNVPNRRWHANSKGKTAGAREVVLIHQAI